MPLTRGKLIVGGVVLIGALGYLGVAATRTGWVYLQPVEEFLRKPPQVRERVRVYGVVGADPAAEPVQLRARFGLVGHVVGGGMLRVEYRGAIPEAFRAGREVVVEGALDEQGVLQADVLMTKCASKYQGRQE